MAAYDPARPGPDALWLAARALARPSVMTTAQTLAARWGRSNDGFLHARQYLENGLGADPERTFTGRDYRFAADALAGAGQHTHAEVLESIAAADGELAAARASWEHRYDGRPLTAAERSALAELSAGQLVPRRRAGQGIDGAWYMPASYTRNHRPAVVMTTSAMTRFVVPFASAAEMTAWLMNRAPEAAGPLMTIANGPATRAGREEEVLAWLVRSPQEAGPLLRKAGARTWTTDLRAELARALQWVTQRGGAPEYTVIAEAFARRLLRAPGTAAPEIGWPGMTRAFTYLRRLAETPVTLRQAQEASGWLEKADAEALRNAGAPLNAAAPEAAASAAPRASRPPAVPAAAARGSGQAAPLLQPPGVPGPGGPAPRM